MKTHSEYIRALNNVLNLAKEELAEMQDRRKSFEDTLLPLGHKLAHPTKIQELQESIQIIEDFDWN